MLVKKDMLRYVQDENTGEMIKGGGGKVVDWIWTLYNMAFESSVETEG